MIELWSSNPNLKDISNWLCQNNYKCLFTTGVQGETQVWYFNYRYTHTTAWLTKTGNGVPNEIYMKIEDIAKITHEINKAYCESIGDTSQTEWENAPEWQKLSAVNGVQFHLSNPDANPELSHDNWLNEKIKDGW